MLPNVICAMGLRYNVAAFSLMICICMLTFEMSASAGPDSTSVQNPEATAQQPAAVGVAGDKKTDDKLKAALPAGKPAAQPAGQPAAQPAGQPAAQPAGQPAGQPAAGASPPKEDAAPGKANASKSPGSVVSQESDDVESSGHFMGYFIASAVACVALYVMYHNRHKMLAFIVEGRRSAAGRRRVVTTSGSAEYRQLSNAEEGTSSDIGGTSSRSEQPKGFVY